MKFEKIFSHMYMCIQWKKFLFLAAQQLYTKYFMAE